MKISFLTRMMLVALCATLFYACQEDEVQVAPEAAIADASTMTLDQIEALYEQGVNQPTNARQAAEKVTYKFRATFTQGKREGNTTTGPLTLTIRPITDQGFSTLRGTLTLSDRELPAKGLLFDDGNVVLVIDFNDRVLVGQGQLQEDGDLTGTFTGPSPDDAGKWVAVTDEDETKPEPEKPQGETIVDIAVKTPILKRLVSALGRANLVDDLQQPGPFTVLAPTNQAFAALERLPKGDVLKKILLYHVISGEFTAQELLDAKTIETLLGTDVVVTTDAKGNIVINDRVRIAIKDIEASNGIIHIIDAVLIP